MNTALENAVDPLPGERHKATLFARRDRPYMRVVRGNCCFDLRLCSKCHARSAHWLLKAHYLQRYYCDDCVQATAAWKKAQKIQAAIEESE